MRFRIAGGHHRVLRIRITLRARRALRRGTGRLLGHAVVAAPTDGGVTVATTTVVLRSARG